LALSGSAEIAQAVPRFFQWKIAPKDWGE
jgi:hypothetical protein